MPGPRKPTNVPKNFGRTRRCRGPRLQNSVGKGRKLLVFTTFVVLVASRLLQPESRGQSAPAQESATETPTHPRFSGVTSPGLDAAALRAEALERLKVFEASTTPDGKPSTTGTAIPNPTSGRATRSAPPQLARAVKSSTAGAASDPLIEKPIRELLRNRLMRLEEYDRLSAALQQATHPEPSPERQAAEAKAELERLQPILAQAARAPETLLPLAFRDAAKNVSPSLTAEMKDALEATTKECKEWGAKLETLRNLVTNWDGLQKARRAERDKQFQRVASLKAKTKEFEAAVASAQTAGARQLAQDRMINLECEARLESLKLQVLEAQIGMEMKLADVRELSMQAHRAHIQIAERTLEQMRTRYRVAIEDRDRDLKRAAANEETKAQRSADPLERFRAHHRAELLVLEAQVLKTEQALATSPAPSPDEQRSLADHAEKDFAQIKGLLDDGRVSRLDAIRLNNDFRRIGPERDRLLRNEMATVEAQLQYYEDTLTGVELELIQDSLHNRYEQDLLRERVPPSRRAEGESLVSELERKHRALLVRRRKALEKLCERGAETLQQVARRLSILNEEYGFIRTHIFWVRDQDPIGLTTLVQGTREFSYLLNGLLRLAEETVKPNLWGRPSVEFLVTALAVIGLPALLVRLRRALKSLIRRSLPALPA
jgi:potassium efflux system protein